MPCRLLALAALALSAPAFAQDLEERNADLAAEEKLETKFTFESEWHEVDNLDFRPLDESSDQAILDSDDRSSFAFTGIRAEVGYQIDDRTRFVMGASHRGHWGNDNLGSTSNFGSWMWFSDLFVAWKPLAGRDVEITLGRQSVDLGGRASGAREYTFADNVDLLRVDVPAPFGTVTVVPVEIVGLTPSNDDLYLIQGGPYDEEETFGFRGEHMTRRHGLIVRADELSEKLDARAYAYYTDIGPAGTGSDITYEGLLGNFVDNDWVANFGARAALDVGAVEPFVSVDLSTGVDRKELVAEDVLCTGYAVYGGLALDTRGEGEKGLRGTATFYRSSGGQHLANGLQWNHGYVGMKARKIGGTLTNRYLGMYSSSYVSGRSGVVDTPHEHDRAAGTQIAQAGASYDAGAVEIGAGWWWMTDTGSSQVDFGAIDEIVPPYGYSRAGFAAEERLGRSLGHELDVDVTVDLSEHVELGVTGAVLLPGEFYALEIDRVAGDQLGGQAMAWAVSGGALVSF